MKRLNDTLCLKKRKKFLLREVNIKKLKKAAKKHNMSKNLYLIMCVCDYLRYEKENNLLIYADSQLFSEVLSQKELGK